MNSTINHIMAQLPLKVIPLQLQIQKAKKRVDVIIRDLKKISLELLAIIVIRITTTLRIISSQKVSYSLDNFYIVDYK